VPPRTPRTVGPQHLAGGPPREREQHDRSRIDALLQQPGDAMDERARLSGARAGDEEHRPIRGGDRRALGVVELGEVHPAPYPEQVFL
jgi:hypothetical protein